MMFSIANWKASAVVPVEDPTKLPTGYPEHVKDKDAWRKWCGSDETRHHFLSAFCGASPGTKISLKDNPPLTCHALIVDYDSSGVPPEDALLSITKRPPSVFRPRWFVQTFSGNYRLVWEFERPIVLGHPEVAKNFLELALAEVKAIKWLAGLDAHAANNPAQYYELGRQWTRLDNAVPLSAGYLWTLASKAGDKVTRGDRDARVSLSMEVIAAEIQKRFPDKWQGEFALGTYGVRFWDPTADHPRGCQVRRWGMQAYSRGPDMTWADIFGEDFIKQHEADIVGPVLESTFFDGNRFWVWNPFHHEYNDFAKEDFSQLLRNKGFDSSRAKGRTQSQIDLIEGQIKLQKKIAKALPFIHQPHGSISYNGTRLLNISTRKCLPPAEPGSVDDLRHGAKSRFPWIYRFLQGFFDPPEQLEYFLGWLKWFYENGLAQEPQQGHALVLAGPASKGKTFLGTNLIANMVGGFADATNYLVQGDPFSSAVACVPLMCVDDASVSPDIKQHDAYSNNVKRLVANRTILWNDKYQKAGQTEWLGRIYITCNTDPESMRIIPRIDLTNLDKISLFMASENVDTALFQQNPRQALDSELPYFCRWLLDWKYPDWVINLHNRRFGVRHYHHRAMYEHAIQNSRAYTFFEILRDFLRQWRVLRAAEAGKDPGEFQAPWSGTTADLFRDMHLVYRGQAEHLKAFSPQTMASNLRALMQQNPDVVRRTTEQGVMRWHIGAGIDSHDPVTRADATPRPENPARNCMDLPAEPA